MPRNPTVRDALRRYGFTALSFDGEDAQLQYEAAAFFLDNPEAGYRVRGIDGANEVREAAGEEDYPLLATTKARRLSTALNMLETVRALRTDVDRYYYLHEPSQARAYLALYEFFNDDTEEYLDDPSVVVSALASEE